MRNLTAPFVLATLTKLAQAAKHGLIVGNFVQGSLYSVTYDDETHELALVANTTVSAPSSWLSLNHDKSVLYGTNYTYINSATQTNLTTPPSYTSFHIHNLTHIEETSTLSGSSSCNGSAIYVEALKVPPYTVYGFDYWGTPGCASVMSVDATGSLSSVVQNYEYQRADSGVHGSAFSLDSSILYAADTLGNAIWTQPLNPSTGEIYAPIAITPGPVEHAGPRHVVLHPSGKALYAVMEGSNQLASYSLDPSTHIPTLQGLFTLLPPELEGSKNLWANEVVTSRNGQYIWSTTRGKGNQTGYLSVFEADVKTGKVLKRLVITETSTSGGVANVVVPAVWDDRTVALTDNAVGFVEVWKLNEDGMGAGPVSRINLTDRGNDRYTSGCCAGAVWLDWGDS